MIVIPKAEHQVAYQDLAALMSRHADKLSAVELLAIAANMIGKMIAMQDHRKMTKDMALDIVAQNIEQGNAEVLSILNSAAGKPN